LSDDANDVWPCDGSSKAVALRPALLHTVRATGTQPLYKDLINCLSLATWRSSGRLWQHLFNIHIAIGWQQAQQRGEIGITAHLRPRSLNDQPTNQKGDLQIIVQRRRCKPQQACYLEKGKAQQRLPDSLWHWKAARGTRSNRCQHLTAMSRSLGLLSSRHIRQKIPPEIKIVSSSWQRRLETTAWDSSMAPCWTTAFSQTTTGTLGSSTDCG